MSRKRDKNRCSDANYRNTPSEHCSGQEELFVQLIKRTAAYRVFRTVPNPSEQSSVPSVPNPLVNEWRNSLAGESHVRRRRQPLDRLLLRNIESQNSNP